MVDKARVIARAMAGELHKIIAADEGCSGPYITRIAIMSGLRRNKRRESMVQVNAFLKPEHITELKSLGLLSHQIRQAVEEYLERHPKASGRGDG